MDAPRGQTGGLTFKQGHSASLLRCAQENSTFQVKNYEEETLPPAQKYRADWL
jgi:hypothetical protein